MRAGLVLFITLFAACSSGAKPASSEEAAAIRGRFADYGEAVRAGDGDRVVALVDAETVRFYERMKDAALTMPAAEVKRQQVVEQITLLMFRVGRSRDELAGARVSELLAGTLGHGAGMDVTAGIALTDLRVEGDRARVAITKDGQRSSFDLHFVREDGEWKFQLTRLMSTVNAHLTQQLDITTEELVTMTLKVAGGDESTFDPPR
jgi:hypothetical protein